MTLPDECDQEYKNDASKYYLYHDIDHDHEKFREQPMHAKEHNSYVFAKSFPQSLIKENKQQLQQNFLLTRDYPREFPSNIGDRNRTPNLAALRALTNAAHYNSCWAFSSMPEIPVMQSDDEFLVDTGIRIPAQFSTSQSSSKIPHLQDFILGKRRPDGVVRSRRNSITVDKGKFKRHSSVEYEDCMKRKIDGNNESRSMVTSIDYEEGLRKCNMVKENLSDQQLSKTDTRTKRYSVPHGRTRFGFDVNQSSVDEKLKRNSLIFEKDKLKITNSKCIIDRTKRHSTNLSLKLLDSKETKQNFKRHSLEEHTSVRRAVKGYFSTLDVNHNQGLSKIPLRNITSRSRTAPTTRASSPVQTESRLRFAIENYDDPQSSASDKHLNRFSSSDEEVDKLCRMLLHSQTAQGNTGITPRSKDRYPIHLLMKKV